MENAGLVDVWIESGLFACNSTDQMMEGKSYYRAVRGYTLAYKTLNRIYWNYFVKWVGTQEHLKFIYLFSFATRAGSPQQHEPITVGP